jgi:hypothetical protein
LTGEQETPAFVIAGDDRVGWVGDQDVGFATGDGEGDGPGS